MQPSNDSAQPAPQGGGNPTPEAGDAIALSFASLGFIGRIPKAPGTFGSLAAALLAPALFLSLGLIGRLVVLAALFVLGALAATRAEKFLGKKDPGRVVIDEVLGQWTAYLPFASLSIWGLMAGLACFRLFDIAKPWPIKRAETLFPDGWGVMADDLVAGVFALAAMELLCLIPGLEALFMG